MPDFAAPGPHAVRIDDGEWIDAGRGRCLKWRRYSPADMHGGPLVLFSHGLGGSRLSGVSWLAHWASWGIAAIAIQHPGTDADALAGQSPLAMRGLLRQAADPLELQLRQHDLRHALDRIAADSGSGRLGLAGHSFGAVSATRLLGERRGVDDLPPDVRIRAAVLFSPSARGGRLPMEERYRDVLTPCLHLTGSEDHGIGPGDIDAPARTLPYRYAASMERLLIVLDGARHADLSGDLPDTPGANILRAASVAYWLRHLTADVTAAHWLAHGLPGLLQEKDRLERPRGAAVVRLS